MANFDAITFGEVLDGKPPVGAVIRVTADFDNPKYINSGSVFDSADYPVLATQVDEGFGGGLFTELVVPSTLGTTNVVTAKNGSNIIMFTAANTSVFGSYDSTSAGSLTTTWNGLVSNDNGVTWNTTSITNGTGVLWTPPISTPNGFFVAGKLALQGTGGNFVYAKSTNGVSWTVTTVAFATAGLPNAPTAVGHSACGVFGELMVVVATTGTSVWTSIRSHDGGTTWAVSALNLGSGAGVLLPRQGGGFIVISNRTGSMTSSDLRTITFNGVSTWGTSTAIATFPTAAFGSGAAAVAVGMKACYGTQGAVTFTALLANSTSPPTTGTRKIVYTVDAGVTWFASVLPAAVASAGANVTSMALINGYIVLPLGGGYFARTDNITNDAAWAVVSFETLSGSSYDVRVINESYNSNTAFAHGPATLSANKALRPITEESTLRVLPDMRSDVNGTILTVLAK